MSTPSDGAQNDVSNASITIEFRCGETMCGETNRTVIPITINGFPAGMPPLVIKAAPPGWDVDVAHVRCPNHARIVKPASGVVLPFARGNGH